MNKTRTVVYIGLFVALEIVITRFLSFQTASIRVGFGFLPIALSSIMFGPVAGGLTAAFADIIRMALFPTGAPYFPGLTISAFLTGFIYGLVLHNKPKSYPRIIIAVFMISLLIDVGLNTFWLSIMLNKAFWVLVADRIISNAVMFPVKVFIIHETWRYLGSFIELHILKKATAAQK